MAGHRPRARQKDIGKRIEMPIQEKGPWRVYVDGKKEIGIMSADYTHDAILYVNGDFRDLKQKKEYAKLIASRLNMLEKLCRKTIERVEREYGSGILKPDCAVNCAVQHRKRTKIKAK